MNSLFKEYKGVFDEKVEEPKKKNGDFIFAYSPFALQDAIGERSVKKFWIEYQKLRFAGIDADELIHKIISKLRDMLAISLGADKKDLNIKKDYPYNKSKKDFKNWNEKELKGLYAKFVKIYHYSRIGGDNLDTAIEKTILNI